MKRFAILLLCAALGPLRSFAQLPSEVLLVVNQSSPRAVHVANVYQDLRGIPDQRVLHLSPPADLFQTGGEPRWVLGEARARRDLLAPIQEKLETLRDPFPTAIVFSPDWPTAIALTNGPAVSLTAFAGAGGRLPPGPQINQGQAASPWFTHPKDLGRPGVRTHRFPAKGLPPDGLRPAMMLGAFHPPLTEPILVEALRRAAAADHSFPVGTICILTNADVRSKARQDQFRPAVSALETKEIAVALQHLNAPLPARITGVMAGTPDVPMARFKGKLVPGSFAEHLTSFAATFQTPGQTKMTHWLAEGAAGTVGTIQEPFAIWTKFPMAVVFERYADGNTLLEALYQSIASPWQSLPMGDPLCRPWGRPLAGLKLATRWEGNILWVEANAPGLAGAELALFVDGQAVPGAGPRWQWTGDAETSGHEIALLLHARKTWAPPETAMLRETIKTPFPAALVLKCDQGQTFSLKKATPGVGFTVSGKDELVQWELWKGERRVAALEANGTRQKTTLAWTELGQGPSTVQARGITRAGKRVRSAPLRVEIE